MSWLVDRVVYLVDYDNLELGLVKASNKHLSYLGIRNDGDLPGVAKTLHSGVDKKLIDDFDDNTGETVGHWEIGLFGVVYSLSTKGHDFSMAITTHRDQQRVANRSNWIAALGLTIRAILAGASLVNTIVNLGWWGAEQTVAPPLSTCRRQSWILLPPLSSLTWLPSPSSKRWARILKPD